MKVIDLLNACMNVTLDTDILVEDREGILFTGTYRDIIEHAFIIDMVISRFKVNVDGIEIIVEERR